MIIAINELIGIIIMSHNGVGNTEMYKKMVEDMDVNAGKVISHNKSIEDVGQEIFDSIVSVASGKQSKSEAQGLGDLEFVPWQIGATM